MKKFLLILVGFIMAIGIVGCGNNEKITSKSDVIRYVNKKYSITDFDVSENNKLQYEVGNPNTPTEIWTVTIKDGFTFYVGNVYYYELFGGKYYIKDNYDSKLLEHLLSEYSIKNNTTLHMLWADRLDISKNQIRGDYANRAELRKLVSDIKGFQDYCIELPNPPISLNIEFSFKNKYKTEGEVLNRIGDYYAYFNYDSSTRSYKSSIDNFNLDDIEKLVLNEYIVGSLYLNIKNEILTKEEKKEAIEATNSKLKIKEGNSDEYKTYDDLPFYEYRLGLSTLYEVLKREGYNVTGNDDNYIVNYNGNKYEISDNFLETKNGYNNKPSQSFYIIINGQKNYLCSIYDAGFYYKDVKKYFDIDIDTGEDTDTSTNG